MGAPVANPCGRIGAVALSAVLIGACTQRLHTGPSPGERTAVIDAGETLLWEIDGTRLRAVPFGLTRYEVLPGRHSLTLRHETKHLSTAARVSAARPGVGECVLELVAQGGREYLIRARSLGGDWTRKRWDGRWQAWVEEAGTGGRVVARCDSQPSGETVYRSLTGEVDGPVRAVERKTGSGAAGSTRSVDPAATSGAARAGGAGPVATAAAGSEPAPQATAATVRAGSAESSAAAGHSGDAIRLGTWNLRKLGHGSTKDLALVARAIDEHFDILAVSEVMYSEGGHPGYDRLLESLGDEWGGLVTNSPRPNVAAEGAEYYAIVYRRAAVRPCDGWDRLRYHRDNDGSPSAVLPDHFLREPAFACFAADAAEGHPGVDFMLAAYRATWGEGDAEAVAAEVGHIDEVFTAMALARPGEDDLIIAGDFNLASVDLADLTDAADRTRGGGSTLNTRGGRTGNLYDHILVRGPAATSELIGDAATVDVRDLAASPSEFYRTVSDHLPILIRLRSSRPDDD